MSDRETFMRICQDHGFAKQKDLVPPLVELLGKKRNTVATELSVILNYQRSIYPEFADAPRKLTDNDQRVEAYIRDHKVISQSATSPVAEAYRRLHGNFNDILDLFQSSNDQYRGLIIQEVEKVKEKLYKKYNQEQ